MLKRRKRNYNDKRRRKIYSSVRRSYADVFLRVIKAGFGQDIRAEVFPPRSGFQMFVFYLEGKKKQVKIKKAKEFNAFFLNRFKHGIAAARRGDSPITYARTGFPKLPVVCIVRRCAQTGKKIAYADADKVYADIVVSVMRRR